MNAAVNVPRILRAMKLKGWVVQATCAYTGINNKTLKKVLDGKVPKRLDAFYRLIDGLNVPITEALIDGSAHQEKSRAKLVVLNRR